MGANIVMTSTAPPAPGLVANNAPLGATSLPSGPLTLSSDELSSLLPMFLGDNTGTLISFPTENFRENLSKDLAVHKYPNVNGARVEPMGNNPEAWQIKAIFTNNIDPDPTRGETWQRGTLFPQVFLQVIQLLRTTGPKTMQHPIYGKQTVQVVSYDFELVAKGPRDGAYLIINLIRTNLDNPSLTSQPVKTLAAGISVQAALQANGPDFPPPAGLSLSQFFGQMASTIQNILQFPSMVVAAVNDNTLSIFAATNAVSSINQNLNLQFTSTINPISVSASIGGALVIGSNSFQAGAGVSYTTSGNSGASTAYANDVQQTSIAANKRAPLGSPLNPFPVNNGNVVATSSASIQPLFASNFAAQKAIQSLTSLNSNPSKNASTFLDKCITSTQDLMQYYISMNRNEVSNTIFALGQMIYALQQAQNQLASSTQLSNVVVRTYVPPSNVSWPQLSKLLNNPLSDLFSLNTITNSNYLYSPANVAITYYQTNA